MKPVLRIDVDVGGAIRVLTASSERARFLFDVESLFDRDKPFIFAFAEVTPIV
jgi:hypothetical protein